MRLDELTTLNDVSVIHTLCLLKYPISPTKTSLL